MLPHSLSPRLFLLAASLAAVLTPICLAAPAPSNTQQPLGGQTQDGQPPKETPQRMLPVPFIPLPGHGAALVYLRINGKEGATFLVDTGADGNFITESLVARLGLKPYPALGDDGIPLKPFGTPLFYADVSSLSLPAVKGTETGTLDITLTNSAAAFAVVTPEQLGQGFFVDGSLGAPFLKEEAVSFDFVSRTMGIAYPGGLSPTQVEALGFGGKGGAVLPLTRCNGNCVSVPATLSDGQSSRRVDLEVDTGGVSTLIPLETAKALSLKSVGTEEILGGTAGKRVLGRVELPSLALGEVQLTNLTVSTTQSLAIPTPPKAGEDPSAHLGMDILKNYRVLIDYPAKVMYIQPNSP